MKAQHHQTEEIVIRIPTQEWETFLAELEADAEPNDRLKAAARAFAGGIFQGDVYHAPVLNAGLTTPPTPASATPDAD
jgi:hypothetical protein